MESYVAINSYLFFGLFTFNSLALFSAEFSDVFSQLFMLLSRDGKIYNAISIIILAFSIAILVINLIKLHKKRRLFSRTTFYVATLIGILVVLFCGYNIFHIALNYIKNHNILSQNLDDNIAIRQDMTYFISNDFFVFIMLFLFLSFFPSIYRIVTIKLNIESKIAKSLFILKPNVTTIIFTTFALAFQPFLLPHAGAMVEMVAFIISSIALVIVLIYKKNDFTSHEIINLFLLTFGMMTFFVCANSILHGNFYNARMSFFALAIVSWCSSWSYNMYKLEDELHKQNEKIIVEF